MGEPRPHNWPTQQHHNWPAQQQYPYFPPPDNAEAGAIGRDNTPTGRKKPRLDDGTSGGKSFQIQTKMAEIAQLHKESVEDVTRSLETENLRRAADNEASAKALEAEKLGRATDKEEAAKALFAEKELRKNAQKSLERVIYKIATERETIDNVIRALAAEKGTRMMREEALFSAKRELEAEKGTRMMREKALFSAKRELEAEKGTRMMREEALFSAKRELEAEKRTSDKRDQALTDAVQKLDAAKEAIEDRTRCVVCEELQRSVRFHGCQHVVVCDQCEVQLTHCPVCRKKITKKYNKRVIIS
ncbi:unnamed protein product [Ectocarpus sp. 8 AP-2014]